MQSDAFEIDTCVQSDECHCIKKSPDKDDISPSKEKPHAGKLKHDAQVAGSRIGWRRLSMNYSQRQDHCMFCCTVSLYSVSAVLRSKEQQTDSFVQGIVLNTYCYLMHQMQAMPSPFTVSIKDTTQAGLLT